MSIPWKAAGVVWQVLGGLADQVPALANQIQDGAHLAVS